MPLIKTLETSTEESVSIRLISLVCHVIEAFKASEFILNLATTCREFSVDILFCPYSER